MDNNNISDSNINNSGVSGTSNSVCDDINGACNRGKREEEWAKRREPLNRVLKSRIGTWRSSLVYTLDDVREILFQTFG